MRENLARSKEAAGGTRQFHIVIVPHEAIALDDMPEMLRCLNRDGWVARIQAQDEAKYALAIRAEGEDWPSDGYMTQLVEETMAAHATRRANWEVEGSDGP